MSKQYVIIQLQETHMSCIIGTIMQSKIHLGTATNYPFTYSEYLNNTLYGPTRLHHFLTLFMQINGLKQTSVIICIPNTMHNTDNFNLLQHTLGFSKDHTVITHIICTPTSLLEAPCTQMHNDTCPNLNILKNNLLKRFLPYQHTSMWPWISGIGASTGIMALGCFVAYSLLNNQLVATQNSINAVQQTLNQNKTDVQATINLKNKISEFEQDSQTTGSHNITSLSDILSLISDSIPDTIYITRYALLNSKLLNPSYRIEGHVLRPKTLNKWLTVLSKTTTYHFNLISLNQHSSKQATHVSELPYSFVIHANT